MLLVRRSGGTTTGSFLLVVCIRRVASRLQPCIGLWRGTFSEYVKVCTFTGRFMSNAIRQNQSLRMGESMYIYRPFDE